MKNEKESSSLSFLYNTAVGRILLKLLICPAVSKAVGKFMDSRCSMPLIKGFIKKNGIDLNDYLDTDFRCFNDCFTRRIKPELRPIDENPSAFISPCDGLVSAYKIEGDTVFPAKQSEYTVKELLKNDGLADRFSDGTVLVIRLCVDNYHRYSYIDGGEKEENVFIPGVLHTVRPIALKKSAVFCENCREYTLMHTENFGDVVQVEIGAMLVGKIKNHHGRGKTVRGDEKGLFLYGGSTVVLLIQKGKAVIDPLYFENTEKGLETPVKMGERVGISTLI